MVENQCGSSDIAQSNEAKLIVSTYATMPMPLKTFMPRRALTFIVRS